MLLALPVLATSSKRLTRHCSCSTLVAMTQNPPATPPQPHPFDDAVRLAPAAGGTPHTFVGHTSAAYWNMVGPYGGITAAVLVQAITDHPARLGDIALLTVNYASGVAAGAFDVTATPVRTNRSTQHWVLSLSQRSASGEPEAVVVITATAMTALRRATWQTNDLPMPAVAAPAAWPATDMQGAMAWLDRYDMRFVCGQVPAVWTGEGRDSLSRLWVRDAQPRALDFASLAALADVFYPRVWLRRATRVPAGTVSMTIYFHASAEQLAENGTGYLLAQAQGQAFRHGFFDQSAQLWREDGTLMATSHQLVYFKQ